MLCSATHPHLAYQSLFVCTANSLDTVPGPLLDRMEVIELAGYIAKEKIEIAKVGHVVLLTAEPSQRYLIPKAQTQSGVKEDQLTLTDEALADLIRWYCRESGVRNLQKHIEKVSSPELVTEAKPFTGLPQSSTDSCERR